ncbi:uncharacterized protein LOC128545855 [Mercenaria mercenaria]|uniref:uncharacterized protein LOC128545855 n=1 Tax=Mercenaria mercenaria TaxID=6596 RepID=UPI00234F3313|nr:uncharacterized protein LOC128545855 [Mercenaria mercenaria]
MIISQKSGLFGLIPAVVVIIFIAVAVGVNKWQYTNGLVSKYIDFEGHAGLWKFCNETTLIYSKQSGMNTLNVKETLTSQCYDITDICSQRMTKFLNTVRYALFASLASMVLAILGTLVKNFVLKEWQHEKQQMALGLVTAMLAFLAGVLVVVGFGVYNVEVRMEGYYLQAAFYLTVAAWLLSWITAAMFLVGGICIGAKMYPDLK